MSNIFTQDTMTFAIMKKYLDDMNCVPETGRSLTLFPMNFSRTCAYHAPSKECVGTLLGYNIYAPHGYGKKTVVSEVVDRLKDKIRGLLDE